MANKTVTHTISFGWFGLLGVILVVFKLLAIGGVETWSWWLVLLPFYLGLAIMLGILFGGALITVAILLLAGAVDVYNERKRRNALRRKHIAYDKPKKGNDFDVHP